MHFCRRRRRRVVAFSEGRIGYCIWTVKQQNWIIKPASPPLHRPSEMEEGGAIKRSSSFSSPPRFQSRNLLLLSPSFRSFMLPANNDFCFRLTLSRHLASLYQPAPPPASPPPPPSQTFSYLSSSSFSLCLSPFNDAGGRRRKIWLARGRRGSLRANRALDARHLIIESDISLFYRRGSR